MKINIGQQEIQFHVEYGSRKKLSMHIDPNGWVTVKAPTRTADEVIMNAVRQHADKILRQLQALEAARTVTLIKEYESEGEFLHLGTYYALHELIENE